MLIRRLPLSFEQKYKIYALKIALNKSYRELEKILGIPKSTIHYNFDDIEAEVKAAEDSTLTQTQALVLFVLSGVFEGKMSTRSVEAMLRSVYGIEISHQTILEILKSAAEVAEAMNKEVDLEFIDTAIFDEIFQGSLPILSMADPFSGMIALQSAVDRTGEQWSLFLEELKSRGLNPQNVNSDGGTGLIKGLHTVLPDSILMRDFFHVLYKISKAKRAMEGYCYRLIDMSYRNKTPEVAQKVMSAIEIFDAFEILFEATRKSCYLMDERGMGYYTTSAELRAILIACSEKMEQFYNTVKEHKAIKDAVSYLKNGLDVITNYKKYIEKKVTDVFGAINSDIVFRGIMPLVEGMMQYKKAYENLRQREYWGKIVAELRGKLRSFSFVDETEIDNAIGECWKIIHGAVKSNSYIEAVNSVVRCHLETFKSIPKWFCHLFTFFWNNRIFIRGKRAGKSPLQIYRPDIKNDKNWLEKIMDKFPFEKFRSGMPLMPIKVGS